MKPSDMFVPFPRTKRPRSPSPPISDDYTDIPSPLDILIKRRRRDAAFASEDQQFIPDSYPGFGGAGEGSSDQAESSTAWLSRAGVNGRRSRQWQHLNAPSSSSSVNSAPSSQQLLANSQNQLPVAVENTHTSSPYSVEHARSHSQPILQNGRQFHMSSSPIRHEPPGSSPFRASHGQMGMVTPGSSYGSRDMSQVDDWGTEELDREWGEYATENSVLHGVHKARNQDFTTPPNPFSHPAMTPIHPTLPPNPQTPYNTNPYRNHPPSSESTQFPLSSPFPGASGASDTTQLDYDDGDHEGHMGMDMLEEEEEDLSPQEIETRRRYEDANRLLAELAVARRRRWGES